MEQLSPEDQAVLDRYRRPRPSDWNLGRPALLVVDVVESFVGPDAPVREAQDQAVTACGEHAWRAVPHLRSLLEAFRAAGQPIAFSTISDAVSPPPPPGSSPRRGMLRADRVIPELEPDTGEPVLPKTRPSMFFGTPLVEWLVRNDVRSVVATGGATSGCVRATVLDAYSHGFDVVTPSDACFDRVPVVHERNLADLDLKYARVVTTADVLERL